MTNKKLADLTPRTFTNTISAILVALFICFAEIPLFRPFFVAAVAAIAAFAIREYYNLAEKKGLWPAFAVGIASSIVFVFAIFLKTQLSAPFWQLLPAIVLGLAFLGSFVHFTIFNKDAIPNIATTFFGVLYIAVPLSLVVWIAYFFKETYFLGSFWIIYTIVVTKSSDMGGYFIGRSFGKIKLAKQLSPNKTLEGALGGLAASIGMSFLLIALFSRWIPSLKEVGVLKTLFLGVIISVFGQVGDLAESLLKRDVRAKDSSTLPGVGGILDMVDSLLFTIPIVYIFLRINYL